MADLYRRNQNRSRLAVCKFCGMKDLHWDEIAPNKHRLHEPNGAVHNCDQFHEAKRNGQTPPPRVERGSVLRRLNNWMQKWSVDLPADAANELEEIIDELAQR